jgi:PAS domain S-box-containing protein
MAVQSQGELMSGLLNHILIVDPNENVRAEVRRLLSQATLAPALVQEASTAQDALGAYNLPEDRRPTVMLLGMDLCGECGDEWLIEARGASATFATPIVLLTQDDADARIDVALAAGARDCLSFTKLNTHQLVRTLQRVVVHHLQLQQLISSESNYRNLIDSAPTLMWVSDATKARVYFNKVWLEFTGRTLEQESGNGWLESLHRDDRQECYRIYSKAFDQRELYTAEYRLRRKDGEYRWIMARGQPRYDASGHFLGYMGSCIDITERKMSEEESRLNEERLRVVLTGSPITVMTVDRDLRYIWVHNPQAGFTQQQMIGKRDDELFAPEVAQRYLDFKREVFATGEQIHRVLEFDVNGVAERYDTRAEPLRDAEGNLIGLTIVSINITERVRSEERSHFLAEASQVLSSSLDYQTTLQQVANAMVPKLADWCSVDILTSNSEIAQVAVAHVDPAKVKWAKRWREDNPASMEDPAGLAEVLRTGKSEFYPEISQTLIDEAIRNAESDEQREVLRSVGFKSIIIVPLITRNKILGAMTLVWSDSDRHYNQADLEFVEELARRAATAVDHARLYRESTLRAEAYQMLSETLEQQVDERTKELQRSNQDLDQFAYIASHDLKAPLRAIDHLSTWLLEDVGHLLPDRSHEHLEKMRSRIKRMEGLLDDLLTYSRAGRSRGPATMFDTQELVTRVIDTVSPPENFTVTIEGELPALYTYAVPLETVLRNLISNSIKHHDKAEGHIWISAQETDGMVEFAVRDNGPGIDPAFHERIFQMFQTLRPRDQVEGSGIGLAVVDKIVTSMGGVVTVESTPGEGATFRFTWPREYQPA